MPMSSLLLQRFVRRLRHIREQGRILLETSKDAHRHLKWATPTEGVFTDGWTGAALECQITKDYHRIERGLSLRAPRQPFGAEVRRRLELGLSSGNGAVVAGPVYVEHARSALQALDTWNADARVDEEVAQTRISEAVWGNSPDGSARFAGVEEMFLSRSSVRDFDTERPVDLKGVTEAVALAINTPSVCNRQAWRVNLFTGKDDVTRILKLQTGNSGFGHHVPSVAVVTVDSRLFSGAGERNQRWIDGGLFAMSFVWALHAKGFATCMLNWAMPNDASQRMREAADLQPYDDIVALVAIGYTPGRFKVARSPRRTASEVLRVHHSSGNNS